MEPVHNIPGSFYLGKEYDVETKIQPTQVHYQSKHLTTHAICVGMTGSGKTGLCISLLEEAAIDNIPILCIDPKGDLGNLLLAFPELKPADFEPWVDLAEGRAKLSGEDASLTDGELRKKIAEKSAASWTKGLNDWQVAPESLKEFAAIPKVIYTPGSNVGVPLTVLRSFDAPSDEVREDDELLRDQISSASSGLLSLLGINADPLTSREHILVSNILKDAWEKGNDLSMEEMIRSIQTPPIKKIGVIDIESFYPASERAKLAMSLNNLMASPAFAGWMQGQSLEINQLLYDEKGRAKISIISIAHLNDSERMFFVTILLNELLSWMRTQSGTGALRALFYMDEVFGYFPPTSNPPSKKPMMTLLKQARAFGLGIVLATQNPVDLDYKGLSNMGTWFLGRLQTQRDKDRVLDGLEGAAAQQGASLDRKAMDKLLSAIQPRVFVLNNANENAPTLFHTRWAFSYLRGPLSRKDISTLMAPYREAISGKENKSNTPEPTQSAPTSDSTSNPTPKGNQPAPTPKSSRPIIPAGIEEKFLLPLTSLRPQSRGLLKPALLASASVHFVRAASNVDHWKDITLLRHIDSAIPDQVWDFSDELNPDEFQTDQSPPQPFQFEEPPAELLSPKNYKAWEKELAEYLFRHEKCMVYSCKAIKQTTAPGLQEFEARIELSQAARDARDKEMDKVRSKYDDKFRTLKGKVLAAEQKLDKYVQEAKAKQMDGWVNIGTSILGSLLGGGRRGSTTAGMRDLSRASNKQGDIDRAQESLEDLLRQKDDMERECKEDVDRVSRMFAAESLELDAIEIPLRKSDTKIKSVSLAWVPWEIAPNGFETEMIDKAKLR
jgi:hypothetical protein